MRIVCWMTKTTNTHSEYIIFTDFQRKQRLGEGVLLLRLYVYCFLVITRLVCTYLGGGATAPSELGPTHSQGFCITHNDTLQSVGLLWTSDQPVAETSTWQHTTLTSMPPVAFEPTISAGERPQTHALDRAATETGYVYLLQSIFTSKQSPTPEGTSQSGCQNILRPWTKSIFHHHTHNSPPTITTLIHINTVQFIF